MAVTEANDSAVARKRRKQIIQSQRSELEQLTEASANLPTPSTESIGNGNNEVAATVKSAKRKAPTEANVAADLGAKQQQESPQPQNGETSASMPPLSIKKSKAAKKTQAGGNEGSCTQQQQDEAKKKAQIRYDPDVPMSKEQLAAWRREARRVRNRESAAASRARIRSRITELEDEVGEWKTKYAQAMSRLQNLEKKEPNGA